VSAALVGAALAPVGAQHADQQASPVAALLEHEVSGSGVWRRDNPEWTPGAEDEPSHWVRISRWGPARKVITSYALSVYADGRCQALSHIVFHLDPKNGGVRVTVFAGIGVVAEGTLTAPGDDTRLVEFTASLPDGTTRRSRDLTHVSQGDTLVTWPRCGSTGHGSPRTRSVGSGSRSLRLAS
jgi:hypothetical protein